VRSPNFVLLGRSGSGKGTQATLLIGNKYFSELCQYISTGNLFRELADSNTSVANKVDVMLKAGKFPPDELAIALLVHEISFKVRDGDRFILDGFPRTRAEAEMLDRFLEFLGEIENTAIIFLDVSRPEASRRMTRRRRSDDTEDLINSRLDLFEQEVAPVIKYYEDRGRLIRVNGEQSIDDVHRDVMKAIQL
jgi:adenylate kinase